ncbi:hypothetical protein [Paraliobacillus ryukyuensis]|uniref:hypothetical protein n=1 Tax=Paraliobacillus ryukyuensis TaxID=200904 RepID=UPI0009A762DC|nr:hypothetical protein [Paraliobacillus ryukyuensis]
MQIQLDELEREELVGSLQVMFREAYDRGLADGIEKASMPHHMRKKDVAEYFQVSLATVENIIRMDGFPRSEVVSARYPTNQVIKWANENVHALYMHKRAKERAKIV